MFVIAKLVDWFVQPLNWVVLLLLVGLVAPYTGSAGRRAAQPLFIAAFAILLICGCQSLPDALLTQLESGYSEFAPDADTQTFDGVIVLGGALEPGRLSAHHAQPELNAAAERMTAAVALWQHNPRLQILFTGGEGSLFGSGPSEAQRARAFFTSMGVPRDAVRYEGASRTTFENAVFSARLAGIQPGQRWLLLTSAWHMPRAEATFRHAGWNVTPYPVDFRTDGNTPLAEYSVADGAQRWDILLHEVVGLVLYRLSGKA